MGNAHAEGALLTYWSFNNVDQPLKGRQLGTFSATDGPSGERYDAASGHIVGSNLAVFHGENIWLDTSNLGGDANGGFVDSNAKGAWGAFMDTSKGRPGEDISTGASLIVLGAKHNNEHFVTLKLSSKGYRDLRAAMAVRHATETAGNSQSWSYALDANGSFTDISGAVFNDTDTKFTERSFPLPADLDNRDEFYLRLTFLIPKGGTCAVDNITITGQPLNP